MNENIFDRLTDLKKNGKKSIQRIAVFLLEYTGDYRSLKITEVADGAYVSNSSVVRFSKLLEYNGFPELKIELANQTRNAGNQNVMIHKEEFKSHYDEISNSFIKTLELNVKEDIDELINDIEVSDSVDIYAIGETGVVAYDFQLKLIRVGHKSSYYTDKHTQIFNALTATEKTVAIGITYSARSYEVLDALKVAHEKGA